MADSPSHAEAMSRPAQRNAARRALGRLGQGSRSLISLGDRIAFPGASTPEAHWQRLVLNEAVDAQIAALGPEGLSAAEISGEDHAEKPWREYTTLGYPEFDLCAPLTGSRRFNIVICEQVLEHVVDPCAAAANLRGLCVPGGHVIVSTPFLIRVHEEPMFLMKDYWRFTPRGLRTLLQRAGLDVDEVGSWGNKQCVVGNFKRWSRYRPWHSLHNESNVPVQVWAFATNPD